MCMIFVFHIQGGTEKFSADLKPGNVHSLPHIHFAVLYTQYTFSQL